MPVKHNGSLEQAGSVGGGTLGERGLYFFMYFYLIFIYSDLNNIY